MTRRYFAPSLPRHGGPVTLDPTEARHAASVMRQSAGDAITLFDGQGYQAAGRIEHVGRRDVRCMAEASRFLPRDNANEIWLAVALPKGDRAREMVFRLTELGVDRLQPILCQRSPWQPSAAVLEKCRRFVVEACKQSGRNRLMQIDAPVDWIEFSAAVVLPACRLVAHPGGSALPWPGQPAHPPQQDAPGTPVAAPPCRPRVLAAIGPEGGFVDDEVAAAVSAGWTTVCLGQRIYRIETAAAVLGTLLQSPRWRSHAGHDLQ